MHRITQTTLLALLLAPALAAAQAHDHANHGHSHHDPAHAGHGTQPADTSDDLAKEFAALDRDGDGYISHRELPADHPLHAHFAHIDGNGDHRLDLAEFRAGASMR